MSSDMGDNQWVNAMRAMNESREREIVSDFEIIINGISIPVNRIYLDCHCDYFKDRFANGDITKEQTTYELEHEFDVKSVQECVKYMYTGSVDFLEVNPADVLRLAHMWGMKGVMAMCEKFMLTNLKSETCVEWVNVAMLCDFDSVESAGLRFIMKHILQVENLHHLHHSTLDVLTKRVVGEVEKTVVAWCTVRARIQRKIDDNPCSLIVNFPIEVLPADIFDSSVMADKHIQSCSTCRKEILQRRLIHHDFTINALKMKDCFKMKRKALKYGAFHVVQEIDEFIMTNFRKACKESDFLQLATEEDLLKYIREIEVACTSDEFSRILLWMRQKVDRYSLLLKVIGSSAAPSGAFQQSLSRLQDFIHCDNCCFIMYLIEGYSSNAFRELQAYTDTFIRENFSSVACSSDITILSAESMQRYSSMSELCELKGGRVVCNALKNWASCSDRRVNELERVIQTMRLTSFSLNQLLEIERFLIRILSSCYLKVLKAIFKRFSIFLTKFLFVFLFIFISVVCCWEYFYLSMFKDSILDKQVVEEIVEDEIVEHGLCANLGDLRDSCQLIAQYLSLD